MKGAAVLSLESAVDQATENNGVGTRLESFRRGQWTCESPPADMHVVSAVKRRLAQSGRPELRSVRVTAGPDGVRLQGRVSSYYLKQLAQASALAVEGVTTVRNELAVC
jgi:osmotically-inducible protein OsmY